MASVLNTHELWLEMALVIPGEISLWLQGKALPAHLPNAESKLWS